MTCLWCMPAGKTKKISTVMCSSKGNFVYVEFYVSSSFAAGLPTALTVLISAEILLVFCESS